MFDETTEAFTWHITESGVWVWGLRMSFQGSKMVMRRPKWVCDDILHLGITYTSVWVWGFAVSVQE